MRTPIIVLALVFGTAFSVMLWRQQHPDAPAATSAELQETHATLSATPAPAKPLSGPSAPSAADLGLLVRPTEPPKAPEPSTGPGEPPHFDVVRIEPTGEAVIAGKGEPNVKVELLASGRVVGEVKADATGAFVILPPPLKPGDYDLTLRQTPEGKTAVLSTQDVAVSVPVKAGAPVIVALAEPGKATKLISGPPEKVAEAQVQPALVSPAPGSPAPVPPPAKATASAPAEVTPPPAKAPQPAPLQAGTPQVAEGPAGPGLAIRSVELENGNGFFASGSAVPGDHVRIYLNGTHLSDVVAGADGAWTVTIKKGLKGGHYAVRADAGGDTPVTSRVEVPFDVPVAMAQAPQPSTPAPVPPAPAPALATPEAPTPRPDIAAAARAAHPDVVPPVGQAETNTALSAKAPIAAAPEPPAPVAKAPRPEAPGSAAAKIAPAPAMPSQAASAPSVATATPGAEAQHVAPPAPGADAVIEQVDTAVIVPGDNLWNISRVRLGDGQRFTQIYAANASQIRDPNLIYPGQVFVMPPR
jgi:nucleoid-associated protein YgaU